MPTIYEIESSGFLQHPSSRMVLLFNPLFFFFGTVMGTSVCPSHCDFSCDFQLVMSRDERTDRNAITQMFN